MELRLFPLLIGFAVGAMTGTRGKGVVKSMAKAYLAMEEKTRQMTANLREDMRDAVEEARYEREQEAALREQAAAGAALHEDEEVTPESDPKGGAPLAGQGNPPKRASRKIRAAAAGPSSYDA